MKQEYIWIGIICGLALIFILSLCKNRKEFLVNVCLRVIFGILAIYLTNVALIQINTPIHVGINELTVGIIGLLGLPGFLLLYACAFILTL